MATDLISVLMERMDTLAAQQARLTGSVSANEQRMRSELKADRRETNTRLRDLSKALKDLEKKMRTEPIAIGQIMNTWWLRYLAIIGLGLMNVDLKHAIALVFQLKP